MYSHSLWKWTDAAYVTICCQKWKKHKKGQPWMLYPAACCEFSTEALEGLTKCTASFTWAGTGFKMEIFTFFCLLSQPSAFLFFWIPFCHWQWSCSYTSGLLFPSSRWIEREEKRESPKWKTPILFGHIKLMFTGDSTKWLGWQKCLFWEWTLWE